MKDFILIREIKPDDFEMKVNEKLSEGKYKILNSGVTATIGYWAFFVKKDQ